jgi:hypothetical protein
MVNLDNNPVSVNITVENAILTPSAFNTICFITKNDNSPRTFTVNKLEDLLNNNFTRDSDAYNFCYGVLLQNKLKNIIIRSVRTGESYPDAFNSASNTGYYFTVIDSKEVSDVVALSKNISNVNDLKLIFYSSNTDQSNRLLGLDNVVYMYNDSIKYTEDKVIDGWLMFDDGSYVLLDDGSPIIKEDGTGIVISCDGATNSTVYQYTLNSGQSSDYFLYKFVYDNVEYDYSIKTNGEDRQEGWSNGEDFIVRDNTNNILSKIDPLYFHWLREGKTITLTVANQGNAPTKISRSIFGEEEDVGLTMNKILGQEIYTVERTNVIGNNSASGNPTITDYDGNVSGYLSAFNMCLEVTTQYYTSCDSSNSSSSTSNYLYTYGGDYATPTKAVLNWYLTDHRSHRISEIQSFDLLNLTSNTQKFKDITASIVEVAMGISQTVNLELKTNSSSYNSVYVELLLEYAEGETKNKNDNYTSYKCLSAFGV